VLARALIRQRRISRSRPVWVRMAAASPNKIIASIGTGPEVETRALSLPSLGCRQRTQRTSPPQKSLYKYKTRVAPLLTRTPTEKGNTVDTIPSDFELKTALEQAKYAALTGSERAALAARWVAASRRACLSRRKG
jgi:hypothetical protein